MPRAGLAVAIGLLAYTFVWMVANASTEPERGEAVGRSSYSSEADGLAGYGRLLDSFGFEVGRSRGVLDAPPAPAATVVLVDPPALDPQTAGHLLAFVRSGGRLLTGGPEPRYVYLIDEDPPRWQRATGDRWDGSPLAPGADDVRTGNEGEWGATGAGTALVGSGDRSLVVRRDLGAGEILYLADTTLLTNELLARADNAAFAIALVRPDERVVFVEGVHGFDATSGLAALPDRWKLAIGGLLVAGVVLLWSRGVRFGPPEAQAREHDPPRVRYIEALADTLARTSDTPPALEERNG